MKNAIESLLLSKGISFDANELDALAYQWETIQSLKGDFSQAPSNDENIGLILRLKEED